MGLHAAGTLHFGEERFPVEFNIDTTDSLGLGRYDKAANATARQ
jgi:hypothetical protein